MSTKIAVSASILSADLGKLSEALALCEKSGVDRVHVDVMDGHFVPNITIGAIIAKAVRRYTKLQVKTHLMIEHPWDYIDDFVKAGADVIGLQVECYGERRAACRAYGQYPKEVDAIDTARMIKDLTRIRKAGRQSCAVINPGTPVSCLEGLWEATDCFLIMSVDPGFAGQSFKPEALPKIEYVRSRFSGDIAVDGGVNDKTAPAVVKAGANVLVTASYFFGSPDPAQAVQGLKALG